MLWSALKVIVVLEVIVADPYVVPIIVAVNINVSKEGNAAVMVVDIINNQE